MRDDFAILILTNGRAGRVKTVDTLRKFKYTGRIFIVIDDEDPQGEVYQRIYGDDVLMFSKTEIANKFDEGDSLDDRRSAFYARNASFSLARSVGLRYFMQMDDDYSGFYFRRNHEGEYASWRAECLDDVLCAMIDYFASIPALSIAMSQGGDHIGGALSKPKLRKAMNTFLCDVERPFRFVGRLNEDVNTYIGEGRRGGLFLTIPNIQVNQMQTQSNAGGLTEIYRRFGTYLKSFYSVMYVPSAAKVYKLEDPRAHDAKTFRIHHEIDWSATTAQIVPERFRKPDIGKGRARRAPFVRSRLDQLKASGAVVARLDDPETKAGAEDASV